MEWSASVWEAQNLPQYFSFAVENGTVQQFSSPQTKLNPITIRKTRYKQDTFNALKWYQNNLNSLKFNLT